MLNFPWEEFDWCGVGERAAVPSVGIFRCRLGGRNLSSWGNLFLRRMFFFFHQGIF
jgi:hypothetical protein